MEYIRIVDYDKLYRKYILDVHVDCVDCLILEIITMHKYVMYGM